MRTGLMAWKIAKGLYLVPLDHLLTYYTLWLSEDDPYYTVVLIRTYLLPQHSPTSSLALKLCHYNLGSKCHSLITVVKHPLAEIIIYRKAEHSIYSEPRGPPVCSCPISLSVTNLRSLNLGPNQLRLLTSWPNAPPYLPLVQKAKTEGWV